MSNESTAPRKPARLEDIAREVGISRSEVSRVLNGRVRSGRGVSAIKQEEIRRVADALGYHPNHAARNLARGRTDTVGMPIQTIFRELLPHYQEIISALTRVLGENGLNLLLLPWKDDPLPTLEGVARARTCDGIILTDMEVNDPRPGCLLDHGQKFVIRGTAPSPHMAAVGMNNVAVGRLAVAHLASLGHERILLHNIGRHLLSGKGRREGFLLEAQAQGVIDTIRYDDANRSQEELYLFAREVLESPDPPTAVYAADEMAVIAFLHATADLGLRVPEDVSIMGSLNSPFLPRVFPHLTHIRIRQDEVAMEVAQQMVRMLHGDDVPQVQTFLEPILVERSSTAPPRLDYRLQPLIRA